MSDLGVRFLTALIAGSIATFAIVFSPYGLWLFGLIVSCASLWEFMELQGVRTRSFQFLPVGTALFMWMWALAGLAHLLPPDQLATGYLIASISFLPVAELMLLFSPKASTPMQTIGAQVLAMVYCFVPLFLLYDMAAVKADYDFRLPLGILMLTWMLDTGAYFSGRFLGKTPLFPRISPKKTWEGTLGGALLCLGLSLLLQRYLSYSGVEGFSWMVVGGIIAVFSQLGDLIESMYKRSSKIKDSGTLLPGHGGMLDRFDGIYLSIPFIYLYYTLL